MTGYAEEEPVSRDEDHHYVFHIQYCPVCGAERVERTRKPGPNPGYAETHIEDEHYDYCLG